MKKITYYLICFLLLACGSGKTVETNAKTVPQGPAGVKGRIVENKTTAPLNKEGSSEAIHAQVSASGFSKPEIVGDLMGFLASDDLQGRDTGSEGIEKAAVFIEELFEEKGIMPYFKSYRDTLTNIDQTAYNVVGFIEGNDPQLKKEFIVIGAHYDHIGTKSPVDGDHIANGANDNAAGTSTVLELARYFGHAKSNKRSIMFALFSAEEKGLLGSKHLAAKLKNSDFDLYTMLNFEMVGVPLVGKDYLAYVSGYERSNLAEILNTYAKEKLIGFLPTAKEFNLFMRSDNYPFHTEFGVPSQTFSTFDFTNFDHYHKVGDEVSLMDFDHMAYFINKFIPVVEDVANANAKEIKYN